MRGIADYEFAEALEPGAHGQVFLAQPAARLALEVPYVAVKVLHGRSSTDTFRRAIRALRRYTAARSPHLVPVYDAGQQDGRFYYAMEYLAGGSLVTTGRGDLVAVADAAQAVADLHGVGLIHRGVSASDVLPAGTGAKLGPLELSEIFLPGVLLTGQGSTSWLEYVDPARLLGEPAAAQHDIWSLGVLLHRVGSGAGVYPQLPTDGPAALRMVASGYPELAAELSEPVRGLVRECLGPALSRPGADEVARRIRALCAQPAPEG